MNNIKLYNETIIKILEIDKELNFLHVNEYLNLKGGLKNE
jgi:hypothetical protein